MTTITAMRLASVVRRLPPAIESSWMALCRRVVVAESLGPSFRQQAQIPILCGPSVIHGKLWLENSS